MQEFKYLMPIDIMEKITHNYFHAKFDNIFKRVEKENIGFLIIGEDEKGEHVLCPARWMEYCFDDDFGCIINSALRYAICRHTYMPGVVVDFIRKYINILDSKTIQVAIEDITKELELNKVDDPAMWTKLKNELVVRRAYLYEKAILIEKMKNDKESED